MGGATLYLNAGGITYTGVPSSYGNGTLMVVQWDYYSSKRSTIQAIRAAGGEVLNYTLPITDYPDNSRGSSQQKAYYGVNRAATQANGWYWNNTNPDQVVVQPSGYDGRLMNVRGSVAGGTSWMRHVVSWMNATKLDPNWQLDGFMLDVLGDLFYPGDISRGLQTSDRLDFEAGVRLFVQMMRQQLGNNIILVNNAYWQGTQPYVNGQLAEHNGDPTTNPGIITSMNRCTHPKRRHMAIVVNATQANNFKNTICTHVTIQPIGTYTFGTCPVAGTNIGNGGWPADALHIQNYNSVTDTSGGGASLSPPANTTPPVLSGTATVGSTLTTSDGTWTGNPGPTFAYQWKRNGSAISGATDNAYVLVTADAGTQITCTVTASNSQGSASATSNALTVGGGGGTDTTPPVAFSSVTVTLGTPDTLVLTHPNASDVARIDVYIKQTTWGGSEAPGTAFQLIQSTNPPTGSTWSFVLTPQNFPGSGTWYLKPFPYDVQGNRQDGSPTASYAIGSGAPWVYSAGFTPQQIPAGSGGGGQPGTARPWVYSGGFTAQRVPAPVFDPAPVPVGPAGGRGVPGEAGSANQATRGS
jgi:hypothetical protein